MESSEGLPRGSILLTGFLIISYVLLRFSKFLLFRFKKSFVTSLRFFAPSLLGTSSLRADVAASVGDNFFA